MKILLIAKTYLPRIGGRELYQHEVLARFSPNEVVVLTPDRWGDYSTFDAKYQFKVLRESPIAQHWDNWFCYGRRTKIRWFAGLARLCYRERAEVVLCETVLPDGLSGWLLNQTLGKPYVFHAMGHDLALAAENEWTRARLSSVLASAAKVIAISDFMKQVLIEQGADPDRVAVVYPGVNPMFLKQDNGHSESIREKYNLYGKKVIVTVSRLVARKGQDKVIEAMPTILDAVPEAVYIIVGDGPDRPRLEALTRTLGVGRRVIFTGSIPFDEVPPFYSAANVFAMPNREMQGDFEGFGIVFLEANARRLPVVGGRSGGAQNAVADGESGFLVDPFDVTDIAQRLIELLRDPGLAQCFGENGRRRVENEFTWDRASRQVRSIITEAAASLRLPTFRQKSLMMHTLFQPDHKLHGKGSIKQ